MDEPTADRDVQDTEMIQRAMPFFGHLEHIRLRLVAICDRKRAKVGEFAEEDGVHACVKCVAARAVREGASVACKG